MKWIIHSIFIFFIATVCMEGYAQNACVSLCTNPGFESGESSWTYYSGTACQAPTSEPCDLASDSVAPFQHALQTLGGFDPIVGGTILPVVPPGGGNNSMRLGDGDISGARASRISITYSVTPSSSKFTYQYAAVLQEPQSAGAPHTDAQRPYFSINVYDQAGNAIPCGELFVLAKSPFLNFFETTPGSSIWYRPWTSESVELGAYIGQCVRIEFTATDCSLNEHYGYAYLDANCQPKDVIITTANNCGGYTLTGPADAYGYDWTNITVGGKTGIVGNSTSQSIDVNRAGTYQLVLASPLGQGCATTLSIAVDSSFNNPVNFSALTGCSSVSTQFTDSSTPDGTITNWAWDFNNDGNPDDTSQNPFYEFPNDGIFPVTLTITVGSCSESFTKDVSVSIPDLPIVQPAGPFCSSDSPFILSVDDVGGTWSGSGISNAATGEFDPALANVGNNTIVYTNTAACPGKDSITIVINPPISNPGPNITLCSGNSAEIGSPSNPGETYNWSPSTGLSASTVANPTVSLINNGISPESITFHLSSSMSSTGCTSTDSVVVTINPPALINAGPDRTICSGGNAALTGSISGATSSYSWSGGSGTFNPDRNTLTTTYIPSAGEISAGSIRLTLTSDDPAGPCIAVSDEMEILINDSPSVYAGPDQTICVGNSVNLQGGFIGTASTGTWSGGSGTYLPNNNDPNANYTPSSAEEAIGYVTLTFSTNNGGGQCGAANSQMTIYINAMPYAYAGTDKELCNQNSIQLSGSISGPVGVTATWTGGAGTFSPDNKTANATYAPTASELANGSFSLTLNTDPIGLCPTSSDQVNIVINPIANINAGPDQTICIDQSSPALNSINLNGSFGGAASSGIWIGGSGTFSPNNSDPNATYTLNASELSKANIILTYSSNDPAGPCPSVNDQMMIVLNQRPIADAGIDQTVCLGSTARLKGIVSGSVSSITWTGGAGTFNPNNTSVNSIYTPTTQEENAGSILFTLSATSASIYCPSASDQMELFINPPPSVDAGIDQTICNGDLITLSASFNGAVSNGTWTGGTGTYSPDNTSPNAIYTPSSAEVTAGSASLTFITEDPAGPCNAVSDQMNIYIDQALFVDAGITQPVCIGSSVKLSGTVGGGAFSGIWSGGTGTYVPNNTTLNAIYTPSEDEFNAGSATLTLTSNNSFGNCSPASSQTTLNFHLPPVVDFSVDDSEGCSIHCVNFTDATIVTTGASISTWNWEFGDGGSATSSAPRHCYSQTGNFSATLKATDSNGCSATLTKDTIVTVFQLPNAYFTTTPKIISGHNPEVSFVDQSSQDVNYWFWDFGDGTTLSPDEPNPLHRYSLTENNYQPKLIVRNANNCYDTMRIDDPIRITPVFNFYIPNAFSPFNPNEPGSNGVNDYFYGIGTGIERYDIWIFDRWGNEIFHGKDINDKWDGKANGGEKIAQRDVYVWKVILTDVLGNIHNLKGTVTLVR